MYADISDRTCKTCGEGTYLNPDLKDGETNYCLSCPLNCKICEDGTSCKKCVIYLLI